MKQELKANKQNLNLTEFMWKQSSTVSALSPILSNPLWQVQERWNAEPQGRNLSLSFPLNLWPEHDTSWMALSKYQPCCPYNSKHTKATDNDSLDFMFIKRCKLQHTIRILMRQFIILHQNLFFVLVIKKSYTIFLLLSFNYSLHKDLWSNYFWVSC